MICQLKDKILKDKTLSKKKKKGRVVTKKSSKKMKKSEKVDNNDEVSLIELSKPLTMAELDSIFPIPRDVIANANANQLEDTKNNIYVESL